MAQRWAAVGADIVETCTIPSCTGRTYRNKIDSIRVSKFISQFSYLKFKRQVRPRSSQLHAAATQTRPVVGRLQKSSSSWWLRQGRIARNKLQFIAHAGGGITEKDSEEDEDKATYWGFKLFEDEEEGDEAVEEEVDEIRKIPARPPHKVSLSDLTDEPPENEAKRSTFLTIMLAAAKAGDVDKAEEVMAQLEAEGLRAGPRLWHGLVCAYVKAMDPEGGVSAMERAHLQGERALSETYKALIRGFVVIGDLQRADDALKAMARAEHDAEKGWNLLLSTLYKQGKFDELLAQVAAGRKKGYGKYEDQDYEKGFVLNAETYLYVIKTHCSRGRWDRAQWELYSMPLCNVSPEQRHWNPVIRCKGLSGEEHVPMWDRDRVRGEASCQMALMLMEEMKRDMHMPLKPDRDTFHALMECFAEFTRAWNSHAPYLQELYGYMWQEHIQPNAMTSVWMVSGLGRALAGPLDMESCYKHYLLLKKHFQEAAQEWEQMQQGEPAPHGGWLHLCELPVVAALKEGKGATHLLHQRGGALVQLLRTAAADGDGKFLEMILDDMVNDGCELTAAMMEEDRWGRSFVSGWMFNALTGWRNFNLVVPGAEPSPDARFAVEEESEEFVNQETAESKQEDEPTDHETYIQELREKPVSRMVVAELRAELESYDIPSTGLRVDVYKRVQNVRRAVRDGVDLREAVVEAEGEELFMRPEERAASKGIDLPDKSKGGKDFVARQKSIMERWEDGRSEIITDPNAPEYTEVVEMDWMAPLKRQYLASLGLTLEEFLEKEAAKKAKENALMNEDDFFITEEEEALLLENQPPEVIDPIEQHPAGFRYSTYRMSVVHRLEVGMKLLENAVALGGRPLSLDFECLMYHAVAAQDTSAVNRLQELHTWMRPSTRHLHPMRAPQTGASKPYVWSAYHEGPSGKKSKEGISSNWAPAQCLDNSTHYLTTVEKCIEEGKGDAAKYILYWMDDARWEVDPELRSTVEALP